MSAATLELDVVEVELLVEASRSCWVDSYAGACNKRTGRQSVRWT
jgi:hypothetical protein